MQHVISYYSDLNDERKFLILERQINFDKYLLGDQVEMIFRGVRFITPFCLLGLLSSCRRIQETTGNKVRLIGLSNQSFQYLERMMFLDVAKEWVTVDGDYSQVEHWNMNPESYNLIEVTKIDREKEKGSEDVIKVASMIRERARNILWLWLGKDEAETDKFVTVLSEITQNIFEWSEDFGYVALIPRQPFFERHEFLCSLSQGDTTVDDLQIVVQYPLLKQGNILGQVLGTAATFNRLAKISDVQGPKLTLTSKVDPNTRSQYLSDDFHLGSARRRGSSYDDEGKMAHVVAEFNLQKFEVIDSYEHRDLEKRHLTFFLSGPEYMWNILPLVDLSYTGETKMEVRNATIDLDCPLPFSIEVRPWFFYDKSPLPDFQDLTARVFSLQFVTAEQPDKLPDELFVKQATAVAEDLILLVSFISRGWIAWYRYTLQTPDLLKTYVRTARETSPRESNWHHTLIERGKAREFLKGAYKSMLKLRAEGTDLFMSLVYYISGLKANYLEEQFTTLFLALERTKDLVARQSDDLRAILPDTSFDRLLESLKEQVCQLVDSKETRAKIYGKMRELNRPSLQYALDSLLSKHAIEYSDLYPAGDSFSLIKTRDELFHSSKEIDPDHLIREFYRLQSLLERLLLSLLGWHDFSRSPDTYTKRWLRDKEVGGNAT